MNLDPAKAVAHDFPARFREIVSDPVNMLIHRLPAAGVVENGLVHLHNGLVVPVRGDGAYYGPFSDILVINRGVHEPLEEFVFQCLLERVGQAPRMLELGAYWGHYSMWMKLRRPHAKVWLVEPDADNLRTGSDNFVRNGFEGEFIADFVGAGRFCVDRFVEERGVTSLDVLHADIQGFEVEMLDGAQRSLRDRRITSIFVSTHSQNLHDQARRTLAAAGYRIEISSDFDRQTTSFDGLIFATAPTTEPLLQGFDPPVRADLPNRKPADLIDWLARNKAWVSSHSD